jgi:hypothetical protein
MGEVDCKTAKLQNCKTAKLQDWLTAEPQNPRTAELLVPSPQSLVPISICIKKCPEYILIGWPMLPKFNGI